MTLMKRLLAFTGCLAALVIAYTLLATAAVPSVPSNTWLGGGDLSEVRAGASATLLPDGRVLVAGGIGDSGASATAERFSPDGGAFMSAAPMQAARANHTATLLANGQVLVAGGASADGTAIAGAELYDAVNNVWLPAGSLNTARRGHTATLLSDGRVLIAGGDSAGAAVDSLEIYDPITQQFSPAGTMSSARTQHGAALLSTGRVAIIGGNNGTTALASTDIFDPATNAVSAGPSMGAARSGLSVTTLLDGRVLVAGGTSNGTTPLASAEVLNSGATGFTATDNGLTTARQNHLAILLPHNNQVLIVGGLAGTNAVASAEYFTPWEGTNGAFCAVAVCANGYAGPVVPQDARGRAWAAAAALSFPADTVRRSGPADGLAVVAGGTGLKSSALAGFATLKTDEEDYPPGRTVTITGSGWKPGEWVTLVLREWPLLDEHPLQMVQADGSGNIISTEFAPDQHDIGIRFYVFAYGEDSQAQTTFRDNPRIGSVTVGSQTGTLISGTVGSVTYTVTPIRAANGTVNGTLSVTSGLPAGVSAGFSPSTWTSNGGNAFPPSTLTLTTSASTPAGTYTFAVLAADGADTATANGTLTIGQGGTTTSVSSSAPTSTYGQSVTFTASVSRLGGSNTPTGTVVIKDGATTICTTAALSGGPATTTASCSVANLSAVTHSITAVYAGDANFNGSTSAAISQQVNPKALTVTGLTAASKIYNATTTASVSGTPTLLASEAFGIGAPGDGKPFTGDAVAVGGTPSGTFATKNVGVGIAVSVSGLSLSGGASGNYTITSPALSADITQKALSATGLTATNKIYDGTTAATLSGTAGVGVAEAPGTGNSGDGLPYTGDAVSVSGTPSGTFASKNVANGIGVSVSGLSLNGGQAGNYSLNALTLSANITPKALTVTGLTAANKIYDGTTAATVSGTAAFGAAEAPGAGTTGDGLPYTSDSVSVSGTPTGTFASKDVASGINVTVAGLLLGGGQAGNYSLNALTLTANITKKALTVIGLTAANKVYDATTTAAISGTAAFGAAEAPGAGTTSDGLPYTVDTVSVSGTPAGTFASKDVAPGISVSVTGLSLAGTNAVNYSLTAPSLSADITKKALTVIGLTAANKVYDATTAATITGTAGFGAAEAPGAGTTSDGLPYTVDNVSVSGTPGGTFASKDVASGISVSVTDSHWPAPLPGTTA
jgi:phosphotransferase system IIA component